MKRKQLEELKKKTKDGLAKLVGEKRLELVKITGETKVGKERNLKRAKNLKHEIAQTLTAIREKELSEDSEKQNQ